MRDQTPRLEIDLSVVRRNIDRLNDYAAAHRLAIRPHTKTHKSLKMAELQVQLGAAGLTFAKVGEAEALGEAADDLLIAYPALDEPRRHRIAKLASTQKIVRVAIDSSVAADALADAARRVGTTIGILIDLDVGMHRTGVQSPEAALQLAQHVDREAGLRLDGLFCYPGHIRHALDQQGYELAAVADLLATAIDLWRSNGLETPIVSGGSTPTAYQSHRVPSLTEIRPGTYIYNDMNTVRGGYCALEDCAAVLVCAVISDAVPGKVVLDAGSKALTSDPNVIDPAGGFGHIIEYPQAKIARLSEEHGEVDISRCQRRPKLGERVRVIPNHICPCVNLQDSALLRLPDGSAEPLQIDARGRLC